MAGIVEQPDAGALELLAEARHQRLALGGRQVEAGNDVEVELAQLGGDRLAVADRVEQPRRVLVGGIGEHERHALFLREGLRAREAEGNQKSQNERGVRSRQPPIAEDHRTLSDQFTTVNSIRRFNALFFHVSFGATGLASP